MLQNLRGKRLFLCIHLMHHRAAIGKLRDAQMRIIVPVKEALPLLFDKDCRKVYKKLKKAKSKLA